MPVATYSAFTPPLSLEKMESNRELHRHAAVEETIVDGVPKVDEKAHYGPLELPPKVDTPNAEAAPTGGK